MTAAGTPDTNTTGMSADAGSGKTAARYLTTRDIPIDELTPFPGNAKRGDVEAIGASLRRNGQYRSLIVRQIDHGPLIVLAGNHTMQALAAHAPGHCGETFKVAGQDRPCGICRNDPAWEPAARCELIACDDADARRINLADNRTAELGTYDNDALADLLTDLDGDLDGTGYTDQDVELLASAVPSLDDLADEYGEPDDGDLWPILRFKVPPTTRDDFYALTDDCTDPGDDNARFMHLLTPGPARMTFRFLASFHYHRDTDLAEIAAAYDGPVELFADSGAFSAATIGATIKRADYAAWLRHWRPLITSAATLDVIGDPAATHRNTLALEKQGLRVLPVFHTGTPWNELERLCRRYAYIALGGMVPYATRPAEVMRWLVRCFRTARDHGTVFHGFGQTTPQALASLPFYSVDSSTWVGGARYGALRLWDDRRKRLVSLDAGDPASAHRHAALLRAHGADPALVARPGFGLKTGKTAEEHRREDVMMRGALAVAYHRLGQWLISRHKAPAPPGWTSTGTCLYLADTARRNLIYAADAISTATPAPATVPAAQKGTGA